MPFQKYRVPQGVFRGPQGPYRFFGSGSKSFPIYHSSKQRHLTTSFFFLFLFLLFPFLFLLLFLLLLLQSELMAIALCKSINSRAEKMRAFALKTKPRFFKREDQSFSLNPKMLYSSFIQALSHYCFKTEKVSWVVFFYCVTGAPKSFFAKKLAKVY